MKILLSLIICSQVAGTCLEPYPWPERFDTQYDCMIFGYEESLNKMQQLGREEVNKYNMYIRFTCTPEQYYLKLRQKCVMASYLTTITYPYFFPL